jgi:hypothetical protein
MLMEEEKYRGFLLALEICQYVWAGISLLGSCFMSIYFFIGIAVMNGGMGNTRGQGPPPEMGIIFMIFGGVAMALLLTTAILNLVSAISIRKRKRKMLTMIMAGVNCISVPLGTALGVFTFILMSNDIVTRMYTKSAREQGTGSRDEGVSYR